HGATLHLARLRVGEPAPAMPPAYVASLFDQYAPDFDRALVEGLKYRGPAALLAAIDQALRSQGEPRRFRRALDLGCGTGLAGVGVILGEKLRYAHAADHVRTALEAASLAPLVLEAGATRTENDIAVPGLVVVAGHGARARGTSGE